MTYAKDEHGRKNSGIILHQHPSNHPPTYSTHTHLCQTCINCACSVFCVSKCVPVFFSTHHHYLILFLSAGTQTCSEHHHHPCLDILEPPENDVLIFLFVGGEGEDSFFSPPLPVCVYLCSFHRSSIKSACMFVGARAPCLPRGSLSVTLL